MRLLNIILVLLIFSLFSCNNRGTRGLRCSNGKAKKTKTYRLKKLKPYPKGYYASAGSSKTEQASTEDDSEDVSQEQEQAFHEADEVDGFSPEKASLQNDSVQVELYQVDLTNEKTETEKTPSKDTIYKRTVERRRSTSTIPNQQQKNLDTLYRRTVEKQTKEKDIPVSQKKKDTLFRRTVVQKHSPSKKPIDKTPESINEVSKDTVFQTTTIRQVNIEPLKSKDPLQLSTKIKTEIDFVFDPNTQFVFRTITYDKDEDFEYYLDILFVPNFDIFLYPEEAEKEINDLVDLLNEYPNKKVYVYGNGGRDDAHILSEFELHNHWQESENGLFGRYVKIHYGNSPEVYAQSLNGLGNSDEYEIKRIKEEGRKLLTGHEYLNVGNILHNRAKTVEDLLEKKGIDRNRIIPKRGEFLPKPNATVKIKVVN